MSYSPSHTEDWGVITVQAISSLLITAVTIDPVNQDNKLLSQSWQSFLPEPRLLFKRGFCGFWEFLIVETLMLEKTDKKHCGLWIRKQKAQSDFTSSSGLGTLTLQGKQWKWRQSLTEMSWWSKGQECFLLYSPGMCLLPTRAVQCREGGTACQRAHLGCVERGVQGAPSLSDLHPGVPCSWGLSQCSCSADITSLFSLCWLIS